MKDKAKSISTFSHCLPSDGLCLNNVMSPQEPCHSESYGLSNALLDYYPCYYRQCFASSRIKVCLSLTDPKRKQHIYARVWKRNSNVAKQTICSHIGLQLGNLSITPVCAPGRNFFLLNPDMLHLTLQWLPNRALTRYDNA